jgi:hypothetical protein
MAPYQKHVEQLQWQRDITATVISESNPTRMLTNSDLERVAAVLQLNVVELRVLTMHCKSVHISQQQHPKYGMVDQNGCQNGKLQCCTLPPPRIGYLPTHAGILPCVHPVCCWAGKHTL